MKPLIYILSLILALLFTSCDSKMTQSATPSEEPTVSVITTHTPVPVQYQLTYISNQHDGFWGVYAMDVGCLDQDIPCFSKAHLLFELSSSPNDPYPILSLTWSPDGKKVAFDGSSNGNSDIFISDWNGENKINITNSDEWDGWPVWTPDGTRIMFETKIATNRIVLLIKDLKGQIIQELLTKANLNDLGYSIFNMDGSKIIFEYIPIEGVDAGLRQIFIVDLDGANLYQITQNRANYFGPSLSPDGKNIVVEEEYNVLDGYSNLVVLCLDGTCNNSITKKEEEVATVSPAWAPFDNWIAYTNYIDYTGDIYLVKKDGSVTIKLTQTNYYESSPAWRIITP